MTRFCVQCWTIASRNARVAIVILLERLIALLQTLLWILLLMTFYWHAEYQAIEQATEHLLPHFSVSSYIKLFFFLAKSILFGKGRFSPMITWPHPQIILIALVYLLLLQAAALASCTGWGSEQASTSKCLWQGVRGSRLPVSFLVLLLPVKHITYSWGVNPRNPSPLNPPLAHWNSQRSELKGGGGGGGGGPLGRLEN